MKKLVSLLSAVAMLAMLAVPASAALTYAPDGDGWYVIETAPTDAEVEAYAPTLTATATKLESEDALKAISTNVNKKFKGKLATHDIYKVTYDMANIGTFVNAYDADYNNAFFGLYDITIGYDPSKLPEGYETYALNYTLPDGSSAAVKVGISGVTGDLNAAYTAGGVTFDTIFPARTNDEGIVVDAGTFKAEYILAYPKADAAVTLPFSSTKITYKTTVGAANSAPATTNVAGNDLVLGSAPAPVVPTYELVKEYDLASGYGWDVVIKNFDSEKTYTAQFTNKTNPEDTRPTATINFLDKIESEGSVAFAALIRLSGDRFDAEGNKDEIEFSIVIE